MSAVIALAHEWNRAVAVTLKIKRQLDRELNKYAEAELSWMSDEREEFTRLSKEAGAALSELELVRRVVDVDSARSLGMMPQAFLDAYELLVDATYGAEGAQTDRSQIVGVGKRFERTKSSETSTRAGAVSRADRAKMQIIKNTEAHGMKRKVDRRVRRLAKEINEWLTAASMKQRGVAGFQGDDWTVNVCTGCAKLGEDTWKFCPRCAAPMDLRVRD